MQSANQPIDEFRIGEFQGTNFDEFHIWHANHMPNILRIDEFRDGMRTQ
jgi:hypothetical protein